MPSATPLGVSGRQNEGRVTGSQIREPFEPIEETPSNPNDTSFTPFQNSPELYSNPFDPGGRETISAEADSLLAQAQSNDELFMFDELPDPTMSQTGVAPARADMKMSVITEPNEFPLFDPPAPQEPFDQEASNREYAAYQEEQKRQALLKERRELLEEDDPTVDEDGFPISENLQRSRREVASENEMMDQRRSSREQARVAQVQERRDLRNWQTEARRAQREGRPVPPMPSQSRRSNTASFSSPGYNASGRMVARVGEATIGVVEDPTQAGKFIPQPGFNSANALSDLAFDIEGQESMDHLLRVAKESGVQSQSIARFDSVQKAAKNLKREDFASDAQFESAKADIKEEYGIVAKQLVDRQKDFLQDAVEKTKMHWAAKNNLPMMS